MVIKIPFCSGDSSFAVRQMMNMLVASSMALNCGLMFAVSGVMLPQLRKTEGLGFTVHHESWFASIIAISGVFGSLVIGTMLDMFGRKKTQILIGIPFVIGWLIMAFSPNAPCLLVARFISGLSAGPSRIISSVYMGEILDPKYRSLGLIIPAIIGNVGSLSAHIIGTFLPWRTVALVLCAPAILSSILMFCIKETPLWYISKGRFEVAKETFRWFRGTDEASEKELATAIEKQGSKANLSSKELFAMIFSKSFIKPCCILTVMMMNCVFSGVAMLSFYAIDLYSSAFGDRFDPFAIMITSDSLRVIVCAVLCVMTKKVPRNASFIGSNIITIISLIALVVYLALKVTACSWFLILCLVFYITSASAIVSLTWALVPEVLPNKLRGFGSGLMTSMYFVFLFILTEITPRIVRGYNSIVLFGMFAVVCAVCMSFLVFVLPETNGKTLQSIEDGFTDEGKPAKNQDSS